MQSSFRNAVIITEARWCAMKMLPQHLIRFQDFSFRDCIVLGVAITGYFGSRIRWLFLTVSRGLRRENSYVWKRAMIGFLRGSFKPALVWVTTILETKKSGSKISTLLITSQLQGTSLWLISAAFLVQTSILEAQQWKISHLEVKIFDGKNQKRIHK